MSEVGALGAADDEPLPIPLGGHRADEHRANIIPMFPASEQVIRGSRVQAVGAVLMARATRPYGVNSAAQLLMQVRTIRRLDDLRFGGSDSGTLGE